MTLRAKTLWLVALTGLFFSGVLFFAFRQLYTQVYQEKVDERLLTAATMARHFFSPDYHDHIRPDLYSKEEYKSVIERYNQLCRKLNLQYLWSVLVRGPNDIIFTSSTSTSKNVKNGDHAWYMDVHQDPKAFTGAIRAADKPHFSAFENQWGHGRMVLVPGRNKDGKLYFFGASMAIQGIGQLLAARMEELLLGFTTVWLFSFLFGWWITGRLNRGLRQLTNQARQMEVRVPDQPLPPVQEKDLKPVARALETSRRAILERNREIEQAHAEMEKKVRQRTGQLEAEIEIRRYIQADLEKFASIVEKSPMMVYITNRRGRLEYANQKFCQKTGYRASEIIGQGPARFISSSTEPRIYRTLWQSLRGGLEWHGWLETGHKDGSTFWSSVGAAPVRTLEGEISHFIFIHEDVTRLIMAEREARQARRLAEKASQAKSEFLSSMSHELRTPLNSILGFTQLLQLRDLGADNKNMVNLIRESGQHLLRLVDDLLDLARIEAGKISVALEPLDLRENLEYCRRMLSEQAREQGLEFTLDTTGLPADSRILWDRNRFRQIILNLAGNALKYNQRGGWVKIKAGPSPGKEGNKTTYHRITVEDNGPGISPAMRERLFQPFDRLGRESGEIEGTGIGLTIVQKIMETLGGHLSLDSEPGRGTAFHVDFPTADRDKRPRNGDFNSGRPTAATIALETLTGGPYSILYVEDNPDNFTLVERILGRYPRVRLRQAGSAEDGLELMESGRVDLVLMDINLPGMDGVTAMKHIRQRWKSVPIMALSAGAMDGEIQRGLAAGFDHYLTKPLNIGKLLDLIAKLLPGGDNSPASRAST